MLDTRDVSWVVAIGRSILSLAVLAGALVGLDLFIYLNSTNSTFTERVNAAFRDAYELGYSQTFDVAYREANSEAFNKGYEKGYEISQQVDPNRPVSRLVETRNPTFSEVQAFLTADRTNENPYVEDEYVCFDFAAELNNNADAKGIQAAYVRLRAQDWGHAVVAFQTVDRGLVFIEPQSDTEVKLVIGQPYPWQEVGATSPLSATDRIYEIELIW